MWRWLASPAVTSEARDLSGPSTSSNTFAAKPSFPVQPRPSLPRSTSIAVSPQRPDQDTAVQRLSERISGFVFGEGHFNFTCEETVLHAVSQGHLCVKQYLSILICARSLSSQANLPCISSGIRACMSTMHALLPEWRVVVANVQSAAFSTRERAC